MNCFHIRKEMDILLFSIFLIASLLQKYSVEIHAVFCISP